jgi:HK97 family phage major capsid protein
MEAAILGRVRETSPMRSIAAVTGISGGSWKEARVTGHTSSGAWVSEQGTRSATGTPTLGITEIVPGEQYEQPPVTQEALDDVDFNIEQWITDEVAMSMSIRENTAYVTGDGVGKPRGFMTYVDGTSDVAGEIEQIFSGATSTVTADGAINLQEALLEAYQPNARFVMRRATRGVFRKLKDGQGNYLLNRDFAQAGAVTMLGKPVSLMADVAAVGSGNLAVAYGDFRAAYRIVDRIGIRVLRDPYSSKPLILFYTTKRTGGGVRNFQAIKIQDCATS